MVVNGHYPGEGRRTDLNDCGMPVHQVLMDYQSRANGGDGWLRYFTFKPSENKIYAYTYSPTRSAFEIDDSSQFVLDYNMQGTPFTVVASNTDVASGTRTSASFSGLVPGPSTSGTSRSPTAKPRRPDPCRASPPPRRTPRRCGRPTPIASTKTRY
jgi:hypothetical protein